MIALTLPEIAAVVGGRVVDDPDGVVVTGAATVDSREVEPAGLFAAFVGERSDGHDFAGAAVAAGAAAVLGSRATGHPTVLVDDPRDALAALAHHVLGRLPEVTVLAVTGSQGKTSTKDLLAGVLAGHAETVATRGSFNNELGLPLTVLRAGPSTRFLLLEMGARGIGHLRELCAVARPDVSVVLNVGKAHLGEFGTQDDIATAKGELVEALDPTGVAVLNADDPRVAAMAARTAGRVVTFGRPTPPRRAGVGLTDVRLDGQGRPAFTLVADGPQRAGDAAPRGRPPRRQRRRRGRRGARGRGGPRVGRHLPGRGRDGVTLAHGGHPAPRRPHRGQRRLQRQPRLDAGRPRGAGRHRSRGSGAPPRRRAR